MVPCVLLWVLLVMVEELTPIEHGLGWGSNPKGPYVEIIVKVSNQGWIAWSLIDFIAHLSPLCQKGNTCQLWA